MSHSLRLLYQNNKNSLCHQGKKDLNSLAEAHVLQSAQFYKLFLMKVASHLLLYIIGSGPALMRKPDIPIRWMREQHFAFL